MILFAKSAPRGGKGDRDCKTPNTHIRCLAGGWGYDHHDYDPTVLLVKFKTNTRRAINGIIS